MNSTNFSHGEGSMEWVLGQGRERRDGEDRYTGHKDLIVNTRWSCLTTGNRRHINSIVIAGTYNYKQMKAVCSTIHIHHHKPPFTPADKIFFTTLRKILKYCLHLRR